MTPKPSDTKTGNPPHQLTDHPTDQLADQISAHRMSAHRMSAHRREVWANYQAFCKLENTIPPARDGSYALMRKSRIVGFYPDAIAAYQAGLASFPDRRFSAQKVRRDPVDLGWFSNHTPAQQGQRGPDQTGPDSGSDATPAPD